MLYQSSDFVKSDWRFTKLSHGISQRYAKLKKLGHAALSQQRVLEWLLGVYRKACIKGELDLYKAPLIGQQTNSYLVSYGF